MNKDLPAIINAHYGITANALLQMEGYGSHNYKLSAKGEDYVLKIYPYSPETFIHLTGENQCLKHLNSPYYPQVIANKDGKYLTVQSDKIFRLLTYLDGEPFGQSMHCPELFFALGKFVGTMDRQLSSFYYAGLHAKNTPWDVQFFSLNKKHISAISDPILRSRVAYFSLQFDRHIRDRLPELRKAYIHNDVNLDNLLVKADKVSGLIDFGDLVYSPLINNVAVCITYAMMDKADPLKWAVMIIGSYHQEHPLLDNELDTLYYLIAARLCTSIIQSSLSASKGDATDYILSNQKQARQLLEQWLKINPLKAQIAFYSACLRSYSPPAMQNIQLQTKRNKYYSPSLSLSYSRPIQMTGAAFQYMYAADGSTFLDAYNNIPHVGHCHPAVVEAGQSAMAKLNTNTRYLYPELTAYADNLLDFFPSSLNKIFLINSGSAASDLAIRLAQSHTQKKKILVLQNGYHGNTQNALDISHYKFAGPGGSGRQGHVIPLPMPDAYRHPFDSEAHIGTQYATEAIAEIDKYSGEISAFIAEPIIGCGGQVPLAEGYLKAIYTAVRRAGGICISDEVQTGFGRVGTSFWGYELYDVVPDIVVLGKPIANGHPMGAVVCTEAVAASFENGMEFFSSFGGNPVSCAIASAVLYVIREEDLQKNALQTGNYFMNQLKNLQGDYPVIGDVRGSGLFIGVDLITDRNHKTPATDLAQYVKNEMRNRHILVSTDGPFNNVIKMKPPLCFTKQNAEEVVENLKDILPLYL